ncbi:MAG TPA: amidohydrolase family protein [Ramlibacter sp.]|nr:amidohydrolase family protein [Ramlibacter sp.]
MKTAPDGALLVRGADVLTMDAGLGFRKGCDVLVQGGVITRVGRELPAGDAEVIDAAGMLLLPGLIDTHTHMWQAPLKGLGAGMWGMPDYSRHIFPLRERFGPQDMRDATFAAGVEMLDNGITGVLDFCHNTMTPEHAPAALQAHRDTGQRILFCYGMLGKFDSLQADQAWRLKQVRELAGTCGSGSDLLRFGLALGSLEYTGIELFRREVQTARELGLPMSFHQNVAGQVHELHAAGLLGPDLLPVHCNPILDDELDLLAQAGCAISFTPESEIGDGRDTAVMSRAHRRGIATTIGVDVPSRVAMDLFSQMRITFLVMRAWEAAQERIAGRWPLTRYTNVPFVQPMHVLEFVTTKAAQALGLGGQLGRVAPGCLADLVLLRTPAYGPSLGDPAAHVVLQASIGDVQTVIVGGQVRKRDGQLVGDLRERAARATRDVRQRLFRD